MKLTYLSAPRVSGRLEAGGEPGTALLSIWDEGSGRLVHRREYTTRRRALDAWDRRSGLRKSRRAAVRRSSL